jgi:hypothetical protein
LLTLASAVRTGGFGQLPIELVREIGKYLPIEEDPGYINLAGRNIDEWMPDDGPNIGWLCSNLGYYSDDE